MFFQIFRLHNVMFGVVILVVSVVCLAMLVLITAHEDADDDDWFDVTLFSINISWKMIKFLLLMFFWFFVLFMAHSFNDSSYCYRCCLVFGNVLPQYQEDFILRMKLFKYQLWILKGHGTIQRNLIPVYWKILFSMMLV